MLDNQLIRPQEILIECVIKPQGGFTINQNPFSEQDYLINRPIIGIQAFCDADILFSPLGSNLPVIPAGLMPSAFLNIQRSGIGPIKAGQWFKWIPLCSLRNQWSATVPVSSCWDAFRVDPMIMQWRDSNIAFPVPAAQGQQYSVPLLITYLLEQQDPTPYRMAFLKK